MQVHEKETQYGEIVKFFGMVLSQYRLYSDQHPAAQVAIRNFSARLDLVLRSESTLTLGLVEGRLIMNEHPLDNKKTGFADLQREFHRLQIESLAFEQGVTEEEIGVFFKVLAIPPRILEEKKGFKKAFEEASFQHIRLGNARYRMINEEEEVVRTVESGAEGAGSEHVRKIERMEEVIEYYLTGSQESVTFDTGRLSYEVERRPKAVAEAMVRRALELEVLRRIVEGVESFLRQYLAPPYIQEGKDFSQPIYTLAMEFKKTLKEVGFKGAGDLAFILERCADAVKVELMVRAFKGGDQKTLEKMAKLCRKGAREKLKESLADLGVEGGVLGGIFSERRTLHRSRKVDVSSEELEELRRIRDRFEEELAHRLEQETAVIEREKRHALDEKERVDNIIRNIGGALVAVDVEGKIQFMNPAAEKLLGLNQGEGKGVAVAKLLKDEHLLALAKGPLRDEADWVTKEIEVKSGSDETRRILQASTAIIENEDGKTVGMLSVLNDITKQKRLDEVKSRFVVNVTHELRTPLFSIEQSLGLLLRKEVGEISPEQEKFLSIVQRNVSRLSRVVNDVLDIAKLEAKKLELRPTAFELGDLVHHVVETVQSWAEGKGVTIEELYPKNAIEVFADPDRLTQVVTNLLGNAINFTPEKGRVLVELHPDWVDADISLEEPLVAVSVQDTGIGIPEEDQQRIFEKFEQGSRTTAQGVSSTGLGLTIAKEIVDLHGGRIWVDGNEWEGSRFTFAIPRRLKGEAGAEQGLV